MAAVKHVDVLIAGSGPAGSSTALHLLRIDPAWAERIVIVDKAVHPREKLCGGGVTQLGERVLTGLGLDFEPAHVPVREVRLRLGPATYAVRDDPVLRVVRRDRFDRWLVQQAERQGIEVRQGEAVTAVTPRPDYVEVITEQATFQAQTLVVADGSRSFVRSLDDVHSRPHSGPRLGCTVWRSCRRREPKTCRNLFTGLGMSNGVVLVFGSGLEC